jgi:hypothetical protein
MDDTLMPPPPPNPIWQGLPDDYTLGGIHVPAAIEPRNANQQINKLLVPVAVNKNQTRTGSDLQKPEPKNNKYKKGF